MYFDPANVSNFPSSTAGMSPYRYSQILKALNTNCRDPRTQVVCGSSGRTVDSCSFQVGVWKPPMSHNTDMTHAMAILRRSCADIAFIPGTTDIGLDDDLLRLRSRRVVLEGYSQINNPNKGLGVIHHGAVSNCTSLYCGGHVASRKESTLDCVKILLLALSGASIESQISLDRTNFFWDRGYGGVEGEVNSFAMAKGAVLVGTAKRMKSFPFTFDQHAGPFRQLIQEKGTMAAYWAVRGTGGNKQFALANRSGLGRVVLMHTTDETLGPGRYTLITQRGENAKVRYWNDEDPVMPYIQTIQMLTESQRTPEWFLLRKFRITGTSAYVLWMLLARKNVDHQHDENITAVLKMLRLLQSTHGNDTAVDVAVVYTHEELNQMVLPDHRAICRNKHLPVSGTKPVLIERILSGTRNEGNEPQDEATNVMNALMKTWFMAPFKSKACREGTLNEPFIFSHFPSFVSQKSVPCLLPEGRRIVIETIHEFGLLCHRDEKLAAFSPDAIAAVVEESLSAGTTRRYVALVEMKSKCSQATLGRENQLIAEFGAYQEINADEYPQVFQASIPDLSYRCQLLHGMASGSLNHAFYVVASLRKIIRVVHIRVGSLIRQQYVSAIANFGQQHLKWIRDGVVPTMTFEAGSHSVDHHSVQSTLDLWIALCRLIEGQGRPVPAGCHLIPEVVATWNRGKGPIDVYSRFQKNCKSSHAHHGPVGAIWLRLIMTCVYNAYHAHNLSRTVSFLMSDECKSFKDFQQRRARQPPFRQFCLELANDLKIEVIPPSLYESCSDNDDDGQMMRRTEDGGNNSSSSVVITYNKREAYFSKLPLIERRKNRRVNHRPTSFNRQSSCVWCCRLDHSNGRKHARHGMKTTWRCSVCEVPLCKRPRYNGQSCFDLFHEAETLFDPCSAEAQSMQLSVRANGNRRPPQPRRVTNTSAGTAGEVIVPPSMTAVRAEGTMVQPSASWNEDDDEDFIPEFSSSDGDDESSPERPQSRRRNMGSIAVPERRTRRRFLK